MYPAVMNLVSTIVTVKNAYCAPRVVSCSASDMIDNLRLMGEANTTIINRATGCSTNSYDNRTAESVTLMANRSYIVLISSQYATSQHLSIWIDFDDNAVFQSTERVAYQLLNSTLDTPVVITIPTISSAVRVGVHRMRVTLSYSILPDPCNPTNTYGETHDYSVVIVAFSSNDIFVFNLV